VVRLFCCVAALGLSQFFTCKVLRSQNPHFWQLRPEVGHPFLLLSCFKVKISRLSECDFGWGCFDCAQHDRELIWWMYARFARWTAEGGRPHTRLGFYAYFTDSAYQIFFGFSFFWNRDCFQGGGGVVGAEQ
jgi:hypothetical protein